MVFYYGKCKVLIIEREVIMNTQSKQNFYDMVYLASCALNRIVPDAALLKDIDLEALYQISKFHSMESIVYTSLKSAGVLNNCNDKKLVKEWKIAKAKAIHKEMLFDTERKEILDFLDENGIWYMTLKGILFKELYPVSGMRQMADNDILYDKSHKKDLLLFMKNRGYTAFIEKKGYHEIYKKQPLYVFEMHTELFDVFHENSYQYYKDVKNRLIKNSEGNYGYHFSDEDFYIYFIAHEYRHFDSGGTGLRSLMDIYIYLSAKGKCLDWDYINLELNKLGLDSFEKQNRVLSMKLFSDPENLYNLQITEEEEKLFEFFAVSGTYGTIDNMLDQKLRKIQTDEEKITASTRIKYFLKRLFPDMNWYKTGAPFCYYHKWSIPFFWIYRVLRTIFIRRKKVLKEIKHVLKR